jgi:hypothetical protein
MSAGGISQKEARKLMLRLGCAGALNQVLNRSFGVQAPAEELATAPLCGGMMQQGLHCGMLWGSALSAGKKAANDEGEPRLVGSRAMGTTQRLMHSFREQTGSTLCKEITGCDQSRAMGIARYLLTGGPRHCIRIMHQWIPAAISALSRDLPPDERKTYREPSSCASEVIARMGGSREQQGMVAGFAGGLGLSGSACGALAAALWFRTLPKAGEGKSLMNNPAAKKLFRAFKEKTGGEVRCRQICGRSFAGLEEHSVFLKEGGCSALMEQLAAT